MAIKTVEFQPARLSPKPCKVCDGIATQMSYDTKGNDVGLSIFHCVPCHTEGRRLAKWFIKLPTNQGNIEDWLGY